MYFTGFCRTTCMHMSILNSMLKSIDIVSLSSLFNTSIVMVVGGHVYRCIVRVFHNVFFRSRSSQDYPPHTLWSQYLFRGHSRRHHEVTQNKGWEQIYSSPIVPDFLTKWPMVYPIPDQKTLQIVKVLVENFIPIWHCSLTKGPIFCHF